MSDESEPVRIRKDIIATLRNTMKDQGYSNLEKYVNDNLTACIACYSHTQPTPADLHYEAEMLRLRISDLERIIRKKDDEITILLKLWERCTVNGEPAPELDISPELEDEIETIIRDWYYDVERKDHSGTDGVKRKKD